ncbi:hypothetical protein Nepgr_028242 [Nepenthes gracilis]|uniref:Uncharacterized protein n=1 Tax=Nepenthes gracilis TaxID=150966 RepID=A0AAD3Y3X4_NEPGR|nr:hypothetical protein Nepgr_028242 [Nepenthes gracilis]
MIVGRTSDRGSSVMCKEFHLIHQTLLLAGTNPGDMRLWEIFPKGKLISQSFVVWDTSKCTLELKHLVPTYAYLDGRDIQSIR